MSGISRATGACSGARPRGLLSARLRLAVRVEGASRAPPTRHALRLPPWSPVRAPPERSPTLPPRGGALLQRHSGRPFRRAQGALTNIGSFPIDGVSKRLQADLRAPCEPSCPLALPGPWSSPGCAAGGRPGCSPFGQPSAMAHALGREPLRNPPAYPHRRRSAAIPATCAEAVTRGCPRRPCFVSVSPPGHPRSLPRPSPRTPTALPVGSPVVARGLALP
jgi:hypothetical protein